MPTRQLTPADVRIGVLTALPKEFAAVVTMLDEARDVSPTTSGRRSYKVGFIPSMTGVPHVVAVREITAMGNNVAAACTAHMAEDFPNLREMVFVGIAGAAPNPGNPENHVRLGDVVVSGLSGVVQYDMLKQSATSTQFRGATKAPSPRLLDATHLLEAAELASRREWLENLARTALLANTRRPPVGQDLLLATPPETHWVNHPADPARRPEEPRLFVGAIGSGNTLLKDAVKRDMLRDKHDLRAFEMEGSGLADACWTCESNYFVIRGTCDYCDENKNNLWQGYAAAIAAAYLRGLLALCPASESGRARSRSVLSAVQSLRQRIIALVGELRLYCGYALLAIVAGASAGAILSRRDSVSWVAANTVLGMIVGACAGTSLLIGSGVLQKTLGAKGVARYLHRSLAANAGTDRVEEILEEVNAFLER